MIRRAAALLLTVAALALPGALEAQDAGAVVGRAARVYRSLRSLRADFTQVIDDAMIGRFESRGQLVQAGQNELAMRFSDPDGDAIVIDGEHVWIYTPSTTPGQVIRMGVPTGPVYGFNILAWLLDRPAERYQVRSLGTERVGGRTQDVVELVPHSPDIPFAKAVLWLDQDDALPRKLEVTEKSGAKRILTLSKIRTNDAVSDRVFRFDVPNGVRIVDQ